MQALTNSTMEIAGPRGTREEVTLKGILRNGMFLVVDSAGEMLVVEPQDVLSWTTVFEVKQ